MKPIKLERSGIYGGKYFRAKADDMIEVLTELLKYYPGDTAIISRDYKLTLKEFLAFSQTKIQLYPEAVVVMAIEDFNFLNSLYKSRKSKRESNKT